MEISQELKDKLKAERLQQYLIRIYNVRMDAEAFAAVGDSERCAEAEKAIKQLETAYQAVEAM